MSKVNQIQNALLEIEGGKFQKLCDAFLKAKGFGAINSIGSVIGKDKTRTGTPDTFIRQTDQKLIFVEYTTQQKGTAIKFTDDLNKCFDVGKTGVPLTDISQIVFCHSSNLDAAEENALVKYAKDKGIIATIYGLEAISFDLYLEHPGLAKDFLGVEIDTGQILSPEDFIENYDSNKLATPLRTEFFHREDDIAHALDHLAKNDLLILSGPAGVGKSRLALEVIKNYLAKNSDCRPFCITNKGQDLFEDIKVYFSKSGHFLIFIDDANRTTGFEYLVDLIKTQRGSQQIKVIATVRDYALKKVKNAARELGVVTELEIRKLNDDEIKELITHLFKINNSLWLDRISRLSSGNPRLAIMAASYAIENNGLNSINDVSSLYDLYFSSLLKEISELNNKNVVAVAGILSLFRSIDRANIEQMRNIGEIFGIDEEMFWDTCISLHEFELVDIYENEVVKISDQVISTYLFYLCFFKENKLSFDSIVDGFLLNQPGKIRDALYPCLNSFDASSIAQQIEGNIKEKLKHSLDNDLHSTSRALFETFWFVLQIDALQYIRNQINEIDSEEVPFDSIQWEEPNTNVPKNELISLLKLFSNANVAEFEIAIELSLDLIAKQPSSAPDVIYMFVRDFGFKRHSHNWNYDRQLRLLNLLIEKTEMGKNELCSRLFLAVSKYLIRTEFEETVGGNHTITIYKFTLANTDTIKKYRQIIWETVFAYSKIEALKKPAFDVLSFYASSGHHVSGKELRVFDAAISIPLVELNVDLDDYANAFIIEKFLKRFSDLELPKIETIIEKCRSGTSVLHKLLSFSHSDIERDQFNNFEAVKLSKIASYSSEFTLIDYLSLSDEYEKILHLDGKNNDYHLEEGLAFFFIALANRDGKLFVETVETLMAKSGVFENQVRPYPILKALFEHCSTEEVQKIVKGDSTADRFNWHLSFHDTIPKDRCTASHVDELYDLIANKKCNSVVYGWDDFQKYADIDEDFYLNLANIVNERVRSGSFKGDPYGLLFNPHTEVCKNITKIFSKDFELLKESYLLHDKLDRHSDYDGFVMSQILNVDSSFLCDYLHSLTDGLNYFSRFDNHIGFDFIWLRTDCLEIMTPAIGLIEKLMFEKEIYCEGIITGIFTTEEHKTPKAGVTASQDHYLETMIALHSSNQNMMEILFTAISYFEYDRKLKFVSLLLEQNQDFELFVRLSFEPNGYSCSGSAVPVLSKKRDLWKAIGDMCNTVALLDHRKRCNEVVQSYNRDIELEKKRDFMGY